MATEIHDYEEGFDIRIEARLKNAAVINAREDLGLTAKEASKLIGISYHTYLAVEGMRYFPGPQTRRKICDFYGLLEEKVFPEELRESEPGKLILEREIPRSKLLPLSEASVRHFLPSTTMNEDIEESERREVINGAIGRLGIREAAILRLYFGLEGNDPLSYEAIGNKFGLSGGRVQQIAKDALKKLRNKNRGRMSGLEQYWEAI